MLYVCCRYMSKKLGNNKDDKKKKKESLKVSSLITSGQSHEGVSTKTFSRLNF